MIDKETTIHFLDNYAKANETFLSNSAFANLQFLSLWLQSHPDTSRMDEVERNQLVIFLQSMSDSALFTDPVSSTWLQIKEKVEKGI